MTRNICMGSTNKADYIPDKFEWMGCIHNWPKSSRPVKMKTRENISAMAMKGYSRIPQSSSITRTSPSDTLVSYPGYSLGEGSYPSAEVQSVYSITPTDWATKVFEILSIRN